jgi:hypothetical protein
MNPLWLKFIGIALATGGSVMFTIRSTRILSALSRAAKAHEYNLQQLLTTHKYHAVLFTNSTVHVERAQGQALLILGTFLIAIGLACQAGATFLDANQTKTAEAEQTGTGGRGQGTISDFDAGSI